MAQSGAGAHPGFTAVPKQEPLAGGEDSDEDGEGETEPGTKPTKYTGVYVEADTGKNGVKVVAKDKDGKKVTKRVGAYTTIEEAATCYAAAAHVLRPGKGTRNSVALTPADRAALKGCTPEVLKVMVDARIWVGKQALESDSPDSRSKSDGAPRLALRNRGEDVDGGDQARIESDFNAFEEEDDEDVGDAMRAMFETNTNRENADVDTNGEEVRVSAGVFRSLLKSQDESAQKVARLENLLLEALAKSDGGPRRRKAERQRDPGQGCMNPKRQRRGEAVAEVEDDDDEVDDDDDYKDVAQIRTCRKHMRSAKSPVLQRALDLLPADKAWKNVPSSLTCVQRLCELVRVQLFLKKPAATMTFYPSSDDKTYGVCAVLDRLPHSFACLALAADKSRRADLNKTLSEWKTRAAGRVRDIALPKLGFFRDERDEASPWARDNARTLEQIRERIGLGADESDDLVLSNWATDCDGMPFASAAFAACAKAAFIPKKAALPLTLKVYHLAWLEHVVSDSIMYWEQRMGRLSNSAGGNGHVVNGLKVLVKGSVSQAIRHFNPEYDEEKEEWIWERYGLRLSACGLESMKPNAGASGGDAAGNDVQSVSVGGV
ncbi:unnamed protein product [Closterium sp. Yama58-4]|nr:unnamed protein product [Closterium sp. Yama58-4]